MASRRGFSLRTFLAEGSSDGLRTIEHSQWVGRGAVVPRHTLEQHRSRPELSGPGIYLLTGDNPRTGCERVFIGQTLDLRDQIAEIEGKDFWSRMLVFAADGPRLHRMHTDYIEARLIQLASGKKSAELDNHDQPKAPDLPEPDREDAEFYIDQLMIVAPSYGVRAFEGSPNKPRNTDIVRVNLNGGSGTGFDAGAQFVVQSGSTTTRDEANNCPGHVASIRASLIERGVLVEDGKQLKFTTDVAFDSAAVAAMVVAGALADGDAWKAGQGSRTTPGRDADREDDRDDGVPSVEVKPIKARAVSADD